MSQAFGRGWKVGRRQQKSWNRPRTTGQVASKRERVSEVAEKETLDVRPARSSAECRAAAHLRALTFYNYPADRSEYARRLHKQMKTDAEWESIENKLRGNEVGYENVQVDCLIATVPEEMIIRSEAVDPSFLSYKIPGREHNHARCVVGTLDINRGPKLPAEEMAGILPKENPFARGYLSNVCTLQHMRRKGIAKKLISESFLNAQRMGVEILYVHVAEDNLPALKLYEEMGFTIEAKEKANASQLLGRPSRMLLHVKLP